ncbi:MAG: hypothetical protein IKK62_04595 [Bacteroidaceae bacterium]|nr:hypothetical protein [Bacteroidaceae bacterium]
MIKISKDEFLRKIQNVHYAISVTGKKYSSIQIKGNECSGIREDTGKPFVINIDNLYLAYKELEHINTKSLKKYVDRVQSPSLAILMEAKLI